jgi:hypothetical protein
MVRMDTSPFIESLRRDLLAAAEAAGPEGRAAAERMLLALEPAMRLSLLDALSQASAEITAELPAGVVEVRLRGREPELVVDVPPLQHPHPTPGPGTPPPLSDAEDEDGTVARITLRIPESVKARAEELAGKSGHSLNAWIVNVLKAATTQRAINVDIDLSSLPFLDHPGGGRRPGGRRMTGWV